MLYYRLTTAPLNAYLFEWILADDFVLDTGAISCRDDIIYHNIMSRLRQKSINS